MPIYLWQGKTKQGQEHSGELEAANRVIAIATLRRQGLTALKVKRKPIEIHLFPQKVTEKDITIFFRQFSTMIKAGLPLVQCLELAERGAENRALKKLLHNIQEDIEHGSPLGKALRKYPDHFDRLTCSLVEAGEQGGILDDILLRISAYKEKAQALAGKIKSALVYPTAVITVAFVVTAILMIFVIPVFGELFSSFGADLPAPTKIAIAISNAFVKYWYLVFGLPVVLVFGIRYLYKTPQGRYQLDKLLLNLPILGDVLRKAAVARFCRTFSTMLAAGVPILDALETVAETSGNMVIERVVYASKEDILLGQTLTSSLEKSGVFPYMVTQMISIGEKTGAMEDMMSKVADFYEEEVDAAVEAMTSLMEPAIMAFLGVVIGGLVIAMYMPIFQMASVI
jgi:type IV pilus assembly protein PilC